MKIKLSVRTYSAYSIGCVVVWAAILSAATSFAPKQPRTDFSQSTYDRTRLRGASLMPTPSSIIRAG